MKVDLPTKFIIDNCIVELQSFAYNPEDQTLTYIDSYECNEENDEMRANVEVFKVDPDDKILELFKYRSPYGFDMVYEAYNPFDGTEEERAIRVSEILNALWVYKTTHTCMSTAVNAWTLKKEDDVQHEV